MHPACCSGGVYDKREAWAEPWYAYAMVQQGHLMPASADRLRGVYASARAVGMPAVNGEANYEGFWRNVSAARNATVGLNCTERVDAACVRDTAWTSMMAGMDGSCIDDGGDEMGDFAVYVVLVAMAAVFTGMATWMIILMGDHYRDKGGWQGEGRTGKEKIRKTNKKITY